MGLERRIQFVESPKAHLALVGAVALLAYANTFGVPFQFDDGNIIVDNPAAHDLAAFFRLPGNPARAVGMFTFALNGSLHGHSVAGYHALNLAIHLAAGAVVYLLVTLACRVSAERVPSLAGVQYAPLAGLAAALLFVSHPIQTQAVTYIVQRFASLVALFYVGAAAAYAHALSSRSGVRAKASYVAALALAGLSIFTKENAITLPVTLLILDCVLFAGSLRTRMLRLVPFWILILVFAAGVIDPRQAIDMAAAEYRPGARAGSPSLTYLLTQPRVILTYVRLVLVPVGQNIDHDVPLVTSPLDPAFWGPMVALVVVLGVPAGLALRAMRTDPLGRVVVLGVGWFAVTLSVESSIVPLADVMFEHRVYLPSIGIFMIAGALVQWVLANRPTWRPSLAWGGGLLISALLIATVARNAVWRSRASLWTDALEKSPGKARPYVYFVQDLLERDEASKAIEVLERASRLKHPTPQVFLNLGLAYAKTGQTHLAERRFREAIARGGGSLPGAHSGLGIVLLDAGRTLDACVHFEAALTVEPMNPTVRNNVAGCRFRRGDPAAAATLWAGLAMEQPLDASVHYNLGLAFGSLGDFSRAQQAFARFLELAGPELAGQRLEAMRWLESRPTGSAER